MNRYNFKWTDANWEGIVAQIKHSDSNEYAAKWLVTQMNIISNSKASHSIGNEEWEIVERGSSETGRHFETENCKDNGCEIFSVRRKIDGVVFTVGDEVVHKTDGIINTAKILRFSPSSINSNKMYFGFMEGDNFVKDLANFQPLPQRTKLFTTEDGVDIFEGDNYCAVNNDFIISSVAKSYVGAGQDHRLKYFSTQEKARGYTTLNKPCLSVNDVTKLCEEVQFHNRIHDRADEDYYAVYVSLLTKRLKELAKSKQ